MVDFNDVTEIMLGSSVVEQIANSQGVVLWKKTGDDPANSYFFIEDTSGQSNKLTINKSNNSAPTIKVFKSTDGTNWESMGNTDTTAITATIPANGKLYLKATSNNWSTNDYYNHIAASGNHNVGGNIMSLFYGDNFRNQTSFPSASTYILKSLFYQNKYLISAKDLVLPATTLAKGCYRSMFESCTALTTAPSTLPATTLGQYCYRSMFESCTSLTTAPELPATTLVTYCYRAMFAACTNLNKVTTYATNISASYCLTDWLSGVSSTGDFYNLGGATYPSGASGIPTGWTKHTSL